MTEGQRQHRAEVVRKAIQHIESQLGSQSMKPTLGDLVRLLQIEKELEAEEPREVRVQWVESDTAESSNKE